MSQKSKEVLGSASLHLRNIPYAMEATTSIEFPSGERCQLFLRALNFGVRKVVRPDAGESRVVPLEPPTVMDVLVDSLYDVTLPEELSKRILTVQLSLADASVRSWRRELVADRCCLQDIRLDATFRMSPGTTTRVLLELIVGEAEVYAAVTINVSKLAESPLNRAMGRVGSFLELRDANGDVRARAFVRHSLSHPLQGILAPFGRPLQGLPLRVDCGDVVLFNFKSLSAQLISAATQSSWDHAAIVYEEDGKLFVLEAVAGGVQAGDANARILDALSDPGGCKVGLRRFLGVRTPEIKAQLWSFAIAMTGRSYKKNVSQIVGSRWGLNKADDLSSVFCSELVAAAFKHIGLLDDSFVTTNVLPKDLASQDFQLRHASLGPIALYTSKKILPATPLAAPKGAKVKGKAGVAATSPKSFGAEDECDDSSQSSSSSVF